MNYKYFTKYLTQINLGAELKAFGEQGWKLIYIEHQDSSPNWFAIFIKEVKDGGDNR